MSEEIVGTEPVNQTPAPEPNPVVDGIGAAPAPEPAPAEPPVPATPAAVAHAEENKVDLTQVQPTGAGGQVTKQDVIAHLESIPPPATPAAADTAAAAGVDLKQVEGTGTDGKILKSDVDAHLAENPPELAYYYCIEEYHPGVPNYQSQPLHVGRIFSVPAAQEGEIVCPGCGRATNAILAEGPDLPPAFVIESQERFGTAR